MKARYVYSNSSFKTKDEIQIWYIICTILLNNDYILHENNCIETMMLLEGTKCHISIQCYYSLLSVIHSESCLDE